MKDKNIVCCIASVHVDSFLDTIVEEWSDKNKADLVFDLALSIDNLDTLKRVSNKIKRELDERLKAGEI